MMKTTNKVNYENKRCFHNRIDGAKNAPFILTCVASSDKIYYENKKMFS